MTLSHLQPRDITGRWQGLTCKLVFKTYLTSLLTRSSFIASISFSSNDDTTGAEAFLLGLKGISSWLKLSAKDKDKRRGDILDILGLNPEDCGEEEWSSNGFRYFFVGDEDTDMYSSSSISPNSLSLLSFLGSLTIPGYDEI